jgi:alcohol dehydrogenase class IV
LEVPSPKRLSIDERRWNEAKETMAQQALDSGSPGNNPRVPSAAEIVRLYDAVWTATRVRL